jgi:hypothetical protein
MIATDMVAGAGTLAVVATGLAVGAGLGMGDVKLAAILGGIVGWATATSGLPTLTAGVGSLAVLLLASLAALPSALRSSAPQPFGPPLVGGTALVLAAIFLAR